MGKWHEQAFHNRWTTNGKEKKSEREGRREEGQFSMVKKVSLSGGEGGHMEAVYVWGLREHGNLCTVCWILLWT